MADKEVVYDQDGFIVTKVKKPATGELQPSQETEIENKLQDLALAN